MKIAICDDEQVMMEHICELVKQYRPDYMVKLYGCGEALLEDAQLYDLIFLDIEMPSINGMEVAENLRKMKYSGEIIFLTGYMEYIQEAFKVRAFRYLQKPIVERQLEEALCSAEEQIRKRYLYLDTGHKKSVKLQDIIYIEAIHNRS
jgi:DNA-binding LytR/AlgR family response regulator